mmetsp:Transcript_21340/g.24804  ORF Transcript_21340/g.24804 Transcript_21340/m.24804 type:complete len:209 (-) Transcript_21340:172-798(-)
MKITSELIQNAYQRLNPIKQRELDLKGYKIAYIENMGATLDFFDMIDLSDNEIIKLGNFAYLQKLTSLLVNNNRITKIQDLSDSLPNLESLMLANNRISELSEINNLSNCKKLIRLNLLGNVVTQAKNYRLYVISRIPSLKTLDFQKVKKKEREEAQELFGKEIEMKTDGGKDAFSKEKIKMAIENVSSVEEINRMEKLIDSKLKQKI